MSFNFHWLPTARRGKVPGMMASAEPGSRTFRLPDGTLACTRPIRPEDGVFLSRGLARLSPAGHAYRFLHYRKRFTAAELHYLTNCDFIDHIAIVLTILDHHGRQVDGVGVTRCVRTREDHELAEVAIVIVDEWQRRGGGTALLRHLRDLALTAGILRWTAFSLDENIAAARLFSRFGTPLLRRGAGQGASETTYTLHRSD